jgi:hypothetical protein
MSLISSGIDKVSAFDLPVGIWADGQSAALPRTCLVRWRSQWGDKLHQVYVNGRYAGATVDGEQRQIVVAVPNSFETPVRIEVFAVVAEDAQRDFGDEIESLGGQSGRIRLSFLREQDLPAGSSAQIYFDKGTGSIDYGSPVTDEPIRIWPAWQDKAGFGLSGFGEGDFGWDGAAAVGFGKGSFGRGWFGFDADTFEWVSGFLQAGVYKFGIKIINEAGNESTASETGAITVIPLPRPAEDLNVASFDEQANELILNISY